MSRPRYARFFKADLQMQTPADRAHWVGDGAKLPPAATDDQLVESARAYAQRCYEVGLDVVGITDHNLGGADGLRYLTALKEAFNSERGVNTPISLFPGFEVASSFGRNAHLLCLFDPRTPYDELSEVLARLGLPSNARFAGHRANPMTGVELDKFFDVVVREHNGVVIAAHPTERAGALNDATMEPDLQKSLICDQRLLALEIKEPRLAAEARSNKLAQVLRNSDEWRRPQPIAAVSSSDCKRLRPGDGPGSESSIGGRCTWLKMSELTIDGLRHAFLDHENRVRFEDPSLRPSIPFIARIKINGASFLGDQSINFSPDLNALVGGSGSGKSTFLEYLRSAAGVQPFHTEGSNSKSSAEATLPDGASVEVQFAETDGSVIEARLGPGGELTVVSPPDLSAHALPIRFPVRFLSQREVLSRASNPQSTTRLLDELCRDDLAK
ncbi:MAG TPA: hypothetical protein DCR14_18565, partial [Acidimicrobiaceae bacterium]|nr:hypothetical protein [Acidimicrobiaceae bacterium]